jgi:hypothetical protein
MGESLKQLATEILLLFKANNGGYRFYLHTVSRGRI